MQRLSTQKGLLHMIKVLKLLLLFIVVLFIGVSAYVYLNKVPDRTVESLISRWAPEPSRFMNVAGMNIHYRDEGPVNDKAPILLLHGTSASLHTWDGWTQRLSEDRRVIRFDLPAFGLTGPEPSNDYSIERYAELVVAILNELKLDSVILAGNSLGGYIAWATAVLHPDRVAKLVLVDASGYAFDSKSVPIAFTLSKSPLASTVLKDFLPKFLVERSVKNVYGDPSLVTDELVERYYELTLREGNRDALKERFIQTQANGLYEKVKSIKVPTLIIWGGKDELIPPALGERFRQDIAGSQLVVFNDLGHVPHEENPALTVAVVREFLDEIDEKP